LAFPAMKTRHWILTFTALLGMLICLRPAWHLSRRTLLQYRAQNLWQKARETGGPMHEDEPLAWLRGPAGLSTLVVLGATEKNLHASPAWSLDGAMPDEDGLAMVFGHRDGHFRRLKNLSRGDKLEMETLHATRTFEVARIEIVDKTSLHRDLARGEEMGYELVLVTCFPFRYAGAAPKRYLVWLDSDEAVRPDQVERVSVNNAF